MSFTVAILLLGLVSPLHAERAEPEAEPTYECHLLEGLPLAEPTVQEAIQRSQAQLATCVDEPEVLRVQWSWGAEHGATVVVTRSGTESLADCVEGVLQPKVAAIIGYCVVELPLAPRPVVTATATPIR